MSRELEGTLYFGVMGTVLLVTILFAILKMGKSQNLVNTLKQSIGLSFILYSLACLWWLFQAKDGFSHWIQFQ